LTSTVGIRTEGAIRIDKKAAIFYHEMVAFLILQSSDPNFSRET
jgi:hypothetical protein